MYQLVAGLACSAAFLQFYNEHATALNPMRFMLQGGMPKPGMGSGMGGGFGGNNFNSGAAGGGYQGGVQPGAFAGMGGNSMTPCQTDVWNLLKADHIGDKGFTVDEVGGAVYGAVRCGVVLLCGGVVAAWRQLLCAVLHGPHVGHRADQQHAQPTSRAAAACAGQWTAT